MAASSGSSSGRRRGGRPPSSGNQRGGSSGPGSSGPGGAGSGDSRSSRPAGSGGNRSGGGGGRNRSGGGRGGGGRGGSGSGSGGRGGGQQGGSSRGRSGGGGSNRSRAQNQRGSSGGTAAAVVTASVVAAERTPTPNEDEALAKRNRRRGVAIAASPGVLVGIVVAAVCVILIDPIAGVIAGAVVGVVVALVTWRAATPMLVRALHAEPADEDEYARVFNMVEGLCASMGLALPTVCVVEDDARGSVTFGRRRRLAVLVVTSGLVDALDPVQLEGVLAHELVHVKCADIVPATMAAAVALPLVAVMPGTAHLVHTLAGRGREFRTDQRAVTVTRYPPGLREALALLVDGPVPAPSSPLAGRGVALVTRWLWTVSLPDPQGDRRSGGGVAGELDDAAVRISALDEW